MGFFLITLIKVDGFLFLFFLVCILVLWFFNFPSQSLLSPFIVLVEFWLGLILSKFEFISKHNMHGYEFEYAYLLFE